MSATPDKPNAIVLWAAWGSAMVAVVWLLFIVLLITYRWFWIPPLLIFAAGRLMGVW